jgi:hypothetical protein
MTLQPIYRDEQGNTQYQGPAGEFVAHAPKEYVALLTQSGTAAPTVTVLRNTFGASIVWTRNSAGVYYGTLAGTFTQDKTACSIQFSGADGSKSVLGIGWATANFVAIGAGLDGVLTDGLLNRSRVAIQVYA